MNQSKLGEAGSIGFWKHVISKMRIGSTLSRWSLSGIFPRFYYIGNSRRDSKDDDWMCEPEQFKGRIIFRSMYNDIEVTKRGHKENCIANALGVSEYARGFKRRHWSLPGLGSEKKWCQQTRWRMGEKCWRHDAQLCRKRSSSVLCQQRLGKRRIEKQRQRSEIHSLRLQWWHHWIDSLHSYFRQSAQCVRSSTRCVKIYPETHEVQGNPPRMRIWNQWWYRQNFLLLTLYLSDWRGCARKPVSRIRAEIRRTSWTTTIDQTLLQCWFLEEYWQRTMLDYTWWGRTWRYENIMSRVHLTSKKRHIPRERVASWKHEQGRYGVEILIESLFRDRTVSWVRIVNGINKYVTETSQEILVASVENRGTEETCREGYTTTKADVNIVSCVYSLSWTKMDRRCQPRLI